MGKIRKHSSGPTLSYIVHTATLCLSLDCILSLLLCTYEKDCTTLSSDIRYGIICLINLSYRLL